MSNFDNEVAFQLEHENWIYGPCLDIYLIFKRKMDFREISSRIEDDIAYINMEPATRRYPFHLSPGPDESFRGKGIFKFHNDIPLLGMYYMDYKGDCSMFAYPRQIKRIFGGEYSIESMRENLNKDNVSKFISGVLSFIGRISELLPIKNALIGDEINTYPGRYITLTPGLVYFYNWLTMWEISGVHLDEKTKLFSYLKLCDIPNDKAKKEN